MDERRREERPPPPPPPVRAGESAAPPDQPPAHTGPALTPPGPGAGQADWRYACPQQAAALARAGPRGERDRGPAAEDRSAGASEGARQVPIKAERDAR